MINSDGIVFSKLYYTSLFRVWILMYNALNINVDGRVCVYIYIIKYDKSSTVG